MHLLVVDDVAVEAGETTEKENEQVTAKVGEAYSWELKKCEYAKAQMMQADEMEVR